MPLIQMHIAEGRSKEMKRNAMRAITEACVASLGVAPEQVRIFLSEYADDAFTVGGITISERKAKQEASQAQQAEGDSK